MNKKQKSRSKEKKDKKKISQKSENFKLQKESIHFIFAIIHFFISGFFLASAFSYGGPVGDFVYKVIFKFLELGYYLLPILFLFLGLAYLLDLERSFSKIKFFGSILFVLSGLGLLDLLFARGGILGSFLSKIEVPFGFPLAVSIMFVCLVISLVIIFDTVPKIFRWMGKKENFLEKEEEKKIEEKTVFLVQKEMPEKKAEEEGSKENQAQSTKKKNLVKNLFSKGEDKISGEMDREVQEKYVGKLALPPMALLSKDQGRSSVGDIKTNANVIERTLINFGINIEMHDVLVGPTVTQYSFKPSEGVKLSRIAALQDDLALALAAKTLRMETPIPGKSLVGIEIPNKTKTTVGLASLLSVKEFFNSSLRLPLAIGKNISGNPVFIDCVKAPHILIAGATGAGKSVAIHTLINSLLYKKGPNQLKFIMIDPKRVELTLYKGLPHLLTPVITKPKSAILSLKWAIKEMNRRYDVLEENKVRDISSYHNNIYQKALIQKKKDSPDSPDFPEAMPYIVIIIDELADIMQTYPRELESGIVTLAQMSRAVGIHLILSTQRPSVNVITGIIKANIPTRIALQVASSVDSRTILDMGGAEKLLGAGDMLYMTGDMSRPTRSQSAFVSEDEVKSVVKFLKKAYRDELPDEIDISPEALSVSGVSSSFDQEPFSSDEDTEDDLYYEAREAVLSAGKASTSYLQRKLRVGYARAARLIDILEERGVVGPGEGAKPRDILTSEESEKENSDPKEESDKF